VQHDLLCGRKVRERVLDAQPEWLVHPHQELVEQKNFGPLESHHLELDRHEEPLLHAEGQVLDPGELLVGQRAEIQDPRQTLQRFAVAEAGQRRVQEHIVAHRQGRRSARPRLEKTADAAFHGDRADRRFIDPRDQAQQGRLASPVAADHANP
jgi:hypothetical protein